MLTDMQADFAVHNIFFDLIYDPINNTQALQLALGDRLLDLPHFDEQYGHADGIDLFLVKASISSYQVGRALSIPSMSCMIYRKGLQESKILSHEMGHCLGLHHTWRGHEKLCPFQNADFLNACNANCIIFDPESCVETNNNAYSCGDCVADTPPDPWAWILPGDINSCSVPLLYEDYVIVNYENGCELVNNPYPNVNMEINKTNIMSYYTYYDAENDILYDCTNSFTPGQIQRIRRVLLYNEAEIPGADPNNDSPDYTFMQDALSPGPIHITSDLEWLSPIEVCKDVIIEAPAQLTIKSVASIHDGVKFVVKPGAHLRVEGGTMTSFSPGGFWKGIEVWGDASAPQIPAGEQGRLTIVAGSLIENAQAAIRLYNPAPADGDVEATTGGRVLAFDSEFRNNGLVAEFRPYEQQNYSYFVNCQFLLTPSYAGASYEGFLRLNGIRGLQLVNCRFEKTYIASSLGFGILSLDANFTVSGNNTTFIGLKNAIRVGNSASTRTFKVQDASFIRNEIGILANAVNHFTVKNCLFQVGLFPGAPITQEGIQLSQCTGFFIMENTFNGTGSLPNTVGIKCIDTGGGDDTNTIYKNKFQNLWAANVAVGNNMGVPDSDIGFRGGLLYECNQNLTGNTFDFSVISGGIAQNQQGQEESGRAAGNTFCLNGNNSFSDFSNAGSGINYFYRNVSAENPVYYTTQTINKIEANIPNECGEEPSGGDVPDGEIPLVKGDFFERDAQHLSLLGQYQNLGEPAALRPALASGYRDRNRQADLILAHYLLDTLGYEADSIGVWLDHKGSLHAAWLKTNHYLEQGDTEVLQNWLMTVLPSTYYAGNLQSPELLALRSLKLLQKGWLQSDKSIFELTSSEVQALQQIAAGSTWAATQARNILDYAWSQPYPINRDLPALSGSRSLPEVEVALPAKAGVRAFPNPADGQVRFNYYFPDSETDVQLLIQDSMGRTILQRSLTASEGAVEWLTNGHAPGLYSY
ncbi:MAG TPA: hypothetical protein PKA70_11710, partial [Saprospiraceae bacterium]|nr:hypothetical protein [Saprospiraceae bacterium]